MEVRILDSVQTSSEMLTKLANAVTSAGFDLADFFYILEIKEERGKHSKTNCLGLKFFLFFSSASIQRSF